MDLGCFDMGCIETQKRDESSPENESGSSYSSNNSVMATYKIGDVCKDIECGKGNCKATSNSTFGYEYECESGWKQAHIGKDDSPNFMPCVIPNCHEGRKGVEINSMSNHFERTQGFLINIEAAD